MKRRPFVHDGLGRDDFTEERIAELIRTYDVARVLQILEPGERERSRRELLAAHPAGGDLWVFGYGSLMWNPACHVAETAPALLHGYHRSFCLSMPVGRGSPEQPGLMLALEPGGRCRGLAFRVAAGEIDSETEILWRREMLSGAYTPRWVRLATAHGSVRAVTFVVNRKNPRYVGRQSLADTVRTIALAEGRLGRCRDYLHNLVLHLDELGISDGPMHRLYDLVERYRET